LFFFACFFVAPIFSANLTARMRPLNYASYHFVVADQAADGFPGAAFLLPFANWISTTIKHGEKA
jgi:hypothetical protein